MRIIKQWQISLSICLLISWGLMVAGAATATAQESIEEIKYEAGFYYTIKKGDTLWDLSQRFNDTPWQWPDLWQENKQISNPHWIYPGERVRLFRKKNQHQYQKPRMEIATPEAQITASTPVAAPAPDVYYLYANVDRVGFIRKPPVDSLGSIFKARNNKTLISKDDLVYIRPSTSDASNALSPGTRLSVYRTLSPTDDRRSEKSIGTQHYITGIAEVTKNETQYTLARIIQTFRAIHLDDQVMAYTPRDTQLRVVDSTPGIDGQLIASEDHTKLMGELFIAFIDKGKQDDIMPGQIYNLYYQETSAAGPGKKGVPLDIIDVGSIFVLHTEQTTSTVVITDSARQILPGQSFRTP